MGRMTSRVVLCRLSRLAALTCIVAATLASAAEAALTNPLAYDSLGSLEVGIGNAISIDTTLGEIRVNGILAFTGVVGTQGGAADPLASIPELAIFSFDNVNIGPGVAITVTGSRGLSLLSRGDVTLNSSLNVNGGNFGAPSHAGGFAGGLAGPHGAGPGGGQASTIGNYAGAGGGGFGGNGGQGGGYMPTDSLGGAPYGSSLSGVLYGGSGGGRGINGDTYGAGGGGGGAIEISAIGQVYLGSGVLARGGQGGVAANGYGGGGGGSGGSIRIAGAQVSLGRAGHIAANGGNGGAATGGGGSNAGGGGGGGRILIQQNGSPITNGIDVSGGAAIGSALSGEVGSFEQPFVALTTSPVALNVRLGTGSTSATASLSGAVSPDAALYSYVDHVGAGFTGIAEGAAFEFKGLLGGGIAKLINLSYATNSRTTETITVKSNGGDATLAVGRGVGPTFATNMGTHPATTINLGSTGVAHSAAFHLLVSNASSDLGVDSPMTSLRILDVTLSGPDAAAFSVDSLLPALLYEQQHANLPIHFHPIEIRDYSATLTIRTDQGAANGAAGQTFTYQLAGTGVHAVPEPAALSLALLAVAAIWARRRH